jgi:hypothetical protein
MVETCNGANHVTEIPNLAGNSTATNSTSGKQDWTSTIVVVNYAPKGNEKPKIVQESQ